MSYLLQNPERYRACKPFLEELKVESPPLKIVWGLLEEKFKEHGNFPTLDEANWVVEQRAPGQAGDLQGIMRYVYTTPVGGVSGEYLAQLLIETEKQKLFDRLQTTRSIRDLEELQDRITAIKACLTIEKPTWFSPFDDQLIANPFKTLETYWGKPIPFGLPEMDMWLQGGGRLGELITLIGLTGAGKSIILLWWAMYQAMQGYFVAYFSFDNVIGELLSRLWCSSSGIQMDQVEATPEGEFAKRLILFSKQHYPGIVDRLLVDKHPRGTKTLRDIERTMDQMEQAKGRQLEAVYVDYGDCVKAENLKKDTRFQLDEVFSGMGALAEEYNCMFVTATQANRAAKYLEVMDIDSAAEAWQKIWHSAVAMALCQSRVEKMQGRARLVVGKARRVKTDYIVPILMNPNNMRVIQDPDRRIEFRAALEQAAEVETRKGKKHKEEEPLRPPTPDEVFLAGLDLVNLREMGETGGLITANQAGAMPGRGW